MTTSHHEYDYDFVPPAEAPVFSPKPEEFKDALAYFEKIRFVILRDEDQIRLSSASGSASRKLILDLVVIVVYHVTIVAIGRGLLKKFWPMVIGCVLP